MLGRHLYYTLKPYLPWGMRIAVRRILARRQRQLSKDVWPIDESASRIPAGWPGWPKGRKFAFVITHDVEGPEGLEKCRRLAELEMKLGFRSSFNFIPEGSYAVPADLRRWLTDNGFEVGVHDLEHDGRLFGSQPGFKRKASRINQYLREWGAAGFRSGFMLRNLDWLHRLNIEYDSSTFDTDPFELQPDGTNTIFPFWIPPPEVRSAGNGGKSDKRSGAIGRDESIRQFPTSSFSGAGPVMSPSSGSIGLPWGTAGGGYIELPYTLPQDSTLFLVLQEQSAEIWIRKLDWIADRGGMALVNVHPDYIAFDGAVLEPRTFPVRFYLDLIQHMQTKYAGESWNALPREVASYVRDSWRGTDI